MSRVLPHLPENPILSRIARDLVTSVLSITMFGALATRAGAGDLDDKRSQLNSQLEAQKLVVEGASKELTDAVNAFEAAKAELTTAETALSEAGIRPTAAKELDTQHTSELTTAETRTKKVKANVAAAKTAYDSVSVRTSRGITVITQQNGGLTELSVLFSDAGVDNMDQRARPADTLFSSGALELDGLTLCKFQLDATKKEADEVGAVATEACKTTAEQPGSSKQAEEAAKAKRAEVAEKVAQRDTAKVKTDSQLTAKKERQSELESESSEVDRRIQERIVQQKHTEEERQVRERSSQQNGSSSSGSSSGPGSSSGSSEGSSSSGGFIHPADGTVSSPCGMRVHPVLGYSKLHDGTDFTADCETSIRATGDGVVSERYLNAGYGNYLMIDHGGKGGTYIATGYNHATSYVVSVGNHMSQGQIIGYVGITGYSTGYHLRLMVWENNSVTNPMSRWFS